MASLKRLEGDMPPPRQYWATVWSRPDSVFKAMDGLRIKVWEGWEINDTERAMVLEKAAFDKPWISSLDLKDLTSA